MERPQITRRKFLERSAAAASLAAWPAFLGGCASSPSGVFERPLVNRRIIGANDRVNVAVIGTGGMGLGHVRSLFGRSERKNLRLGWVCDVYRKRLNIAVMEIAGNEKSGTLFYEEILENPDVDAVFIATPDHWHTKIAIEAMQAGKDVYVEKPLSLTIEQALECRDWVHRTNRVVQVGPQRTSYPTWKTARDAIQSGRIGKVSWSQAAFCRNSREGQFNWKIDAQASPQAGRESEHYVDWDRWLGHQWNLAPKIPWNPDHFFRFRKYYAYNGGVATDLLYHFLAPILMAVTGPDGEYPERVVASGGRYVEKDERDIPDTYMTMIDYPSEHTVVLVSVMINDVGLPSVIHGQQGTIEVGGEKVKVSEQATWWEQFREKNADHVTTRRLADATGKLQPRPKPGDAVFELEPAAQPDHTDNFLDAIRGDAELACNVDLGCSVMVAIKMGIEAFRRGCAMRWDATRERMRSS